MFMQNFSSLACIQMGLDKFLTIFEKKSGIFRKTLKRIPNKLKTEYAMLYLI
jgi:hypothetical protein